VSVHEDGPSWEPTAFSDVGKSPTAKGFATYLSNPTLLMRFFRGQVAVTSAAVCRLIALNAPSLRGILPANMA